MSFLCNFRKKQYGVVFVLYKNFFCRNICTFLQKIYNFRVDFTDCFTTTVKFEKNYDLFNLKFSCIKEKQIFADAVS